MMTIIICGLLSAFGLFLGWRCLVWGYRLVTGTRYSGDYEWWFAWRPVWLSGPDEWDRCRAGRHSARLMWGRWVMRMRCEPSSYYVLPNWHGTRFVMLERPWWHFWACDPKPCSRCWIYDDAPKCAVCPFQR